MFEASLDDASILKKIIDAIRELVKDVNIEVDPTGMKIQAMDISHAALVSVTLKAEGFKSFSASKPITLGTSDFSIL